MCAHVWHVHLCAGAHIGQRGCWIPLELELQGIMSRQCGYVLATELRASVRAVSTLSPLSHLSRFLKLNICYQVGVVAYAFNSSAQDRQISASSRPARAT